MASKAPLKPVTAAAFKQAVDATSCKGNSQPALRALGSYRQHLDLANAADGSLDVDTTLEPIDKGHRWDYAIAYGGAVLYFEVHSANGDSQADDLVKKAAWLRQWLKSQGAALGKLPTWRPFVWANRGKVSFLQEARVRRLLQQNGIVGPVSPLTDGFLRKNCGIG